MRSPQGVAAASDEKMAPLVGRLSFRGPATGAQTEPIEDDKLFMELNYALS